MKTTIDINHKYRLTSFLVALVWLVLLVPMTDDAAAQNNPQQDAQDILDQTQEIIEMVRELVMESESEQARRILEDAVSRQSNAHTMMNGNRYRMAVQLSLKAREAARQAERIARDAMTFDNRAQDYLERMHDMHDEVKQRAMEGNNELAMRFVREAEQVYLRAQEQFRQTHYEAAYKLLQLAEQNLQRASRILFESGDGERLANDLDRTEELIARAAELIGDKTDRALIDLLDMAEQALTDARQSMNSGNPLRAMRQGNRAREQAQRVLRQVGHVPSPDSVQAQFDRFDERLPGIAERVQSSGNEQAQELLRRSIELRTQAQQALENGNAQLSLRKIRSALNMQHRASELMR
jgi:tetratricopeptide (TPR) repeat protein